jgi:hypothetical protein
MLRSELDSRRTCAHGGGLLRMIRLYNCRNFNICSFPDFITYNNVYMMLLITIHRAFAVLQLLLHQLVQLYDLGLSEALCWTSDYKVVSQIGTGQAGPRNDMVKQTYSPDDGQSNGAASTSSLVRTLRVLVSFHKTVTQME